MNRPPSLNLQERVRRARPQLEQSGISYALTYVGYVPVLAPVHRMNSKEREALIKQVLLTLSALKHKTSLPTPDRLASELMGEPKLLDIKVMLNINSSKISVTYNEREKLEYKPKLGMLYRQHPVMFTSIVDFIPEINDCFAYISKRINSDDRRCCVFLAAPKAIKEVFDTLEEAIEINTHNGENENGKSTPTGNHSRNNSSGAVTPTPGNDNSRYSDLFKFKWYHGSIGRETAVSFLHNKGDFLIRDSSTVRNQLILSAICEQGVQRHIELFSLDGSLRVGNLLFPSVEDMINHFMEKKTPIRNTVVSTEMFLRWPVPRVE
ncbi:unnamed protein product [Auanema sp. JU1783]|nr:unnamed protein product [Auanema sp. JU1783]